MPEYTAAEAAAQLHISPDTVKRKARAGQLQARVDERGRWLVTIEEQTPTAPAAELTEALTRLAAAEARLATAEALLTSVQAHRDSLEEAVSRLERQLEQANDAASETRKLMALQLQALPAPRQDTETAGNSTQQDTKPGRKWWPW